MVGAERPLLPEILGQTDPLGAKTPDRKDFAISRSRTENDDDGVWRMSTYFTVKYLRVDSVEILAERSNGAVGEAEWVVEVGSAECRRVDRHNELIVAVALVTRTVMLGSNTVQWTSTAPM